MFETNCNDILHKVVSAFVDFGKCSDSVYRAEIVLITYALSPDETTSRLNTQVTYLALKRFCDRGHSACQYFFSNAYYYLKRLTLCAICTHKFATKQTLIMNLSRSKKQDLPFISRGCIFVLGLSPAMMKRISASLALSLCCRRVTFSSQTVTVILGSSSLRLMALEFYSGVDVST